MQLRKIIKTLGHFPNDEAAIKLLWLALRNVLAKTVRSAFDWKSAMNQFAILFGERFTQAVDNALFNLLAHKNADRFCRSRDTCAPNVIASRFRAPSSHIS